MESVGLGHAIRIDEPYDRMARCSPANVPRRTRPAAVSGNIANRKLPDDLSRLVCRSIVNQYDFFQAVSADQRHHRL
jgi:hypothetical protein